MTQAKVCFKIIVEFTVGCEWNVFMEWTSVVHGRSSIGSEKTKPLAGDENETTSVVYSKQPRLHSGFYVY